MEDGVTRRILAYTWVVVALVFVQVVWVGLARYLARQPGSRPSAALSRPDSRLPYPGAGGTGVRILQFYASPGEVVQGDRAIVCYGVENARSVRIEPAVETLRPALTRCFWVEPERDTTYKLVAEGNDGSQAAESFTLTVTPPPPAILFVALSDREVRLGEPITLCYGLQHAYSASLEPLGMPLAPVEKSCVRIIPPRTLDFTLIARGEGGRTDREKFRVRVKTGR